MGDSIDAKPRTGRRTFARAALAVTVLASLLLGGGLVVASWRAAPPPPRPGAEGAPAAANAVTADYSNILASDYVGPEACGECHERNYRHWSASLHASMNRRVDGSADADAAVRGDFSGVRLAYAGGEASFARDGDAYVMTLAGRAAPPRRFRITRTIGSRYLQEYVGVQTEGPEPPGDPVYATEIRLPFGWWPRARGWRHQQYFDSWYAAEYRDDGALAVDPYRPDTTPWASRCAWCHNTYPFELRALRTLRDPPLGEGTEQYFELTTTPRSPAARAAIVDDNRLPVDELVSVGISCESCHLGGREHASSGRDIRFVPAGAELRARADAPELAGGRQNSVLVITICAQCHSTPTPRFPDGSGQRNSSEALDLAAGACMAQIKCTDCHDPHVAGPGARAPDQARHLAACVGCHRHLAPSGAARAHSRHRAGSASCLDCHMPRIVQGVSDFTRSHRISSPAAPAMLAAAAPNACNLCHLDRSIAWTLGALASGWGVRLAPDSSWTAAYGGRLDTPLGEVWLASASPAERAVAAAAYARSPLGRAALPALLRVLDDPIAYYRMRVLFAIEDILGRPLTPAEYDPIAAPATRAAQLERLRTR